MTSQQSSTDDQQSSNQQRHDRFGRTAGDLSMAALRYALPAVMVLFGVIVMVMGSESNAEGGAGIVSAGLAVYAMNWLYRASIDGDRVREEEEAARTYLTVHGRWPDEAPSA